MIKECKRHQWRIGAGIGGIVNGKLKTIGLNIWCWKCGKVIRAYNDVQGISKIKSRTTKARRR